MKKLFVADSFLTHLDLAMLDVHSAKTKNAHVVFKAFLHHAEYKKFKSK